MDDRADKNTAGTDRVQTEAGGRGRSAGETGQPGDMDYYRKTDRAGCGCSE